MDYRFNHTRPHCNVSPDFFLLHLKRFVHYQSPHFRVRLIAVAPTFPGFCCSVAQALFWKDRNIIKNGYERRARWHHWKYLRKSTLLRVYNLSMLVVCNMIRVLLIHKGNYKPCSDSIQEFFILGSEWPKEDRRSLVCDPSDLNLSVDCGYNFQCRWTA